MKTIPLTCVPLFLLAVLTSTARGEVSYQYDDLGRLTTVSGTTVSGANKVVKFSYDTVGNINSDANGDGVADANGATPGAAPPARRAQ